MKQTIFETKERANELLKESIEIWRKGDFSESLEGIEKDPVFSLLIGALAYQENELESDFAVIKQEIIDSFAHFMTPFEVGHAVPASIVISTIPMNSLTETLINCDSEFKIGEYSFIPLFNSKVINASVGDIERLDGRRWKISLNFTYPVKDLSGFCFAVKDVNFRSMSVRIKGINFHLIRSWNYTDLPYSKYFSPDSLIYNHGEFFTGSMLPLDLFVRQNIRMFWFENFEVSQNDQEFTQLELIFEFSGIKEDFIFNKDNIILNPLFLVNASIKETTLTSATPLTRISGYSEYNNDNSQQFLQLIKPSDNQIYGNAELEVRKISGDRFNQGNLIKLLSSIVNKYHTDFYAYQNLDEMKSDKLIFNLQELLAKMIKISQRNYQKNIAGVYLLLHDKNRFKDPSFSVTVKYLTTSGAVVNSFLNQQAEVTCPGSLDNGATRIISSPCPGLDEVNSDTLTKSLLKYYMITNDRVVTPADIKLFCKKELQRIYSLGEEAVKEIKVDRRLSKDNYGPGYEICVDIKLGGSPIVKRSLSDKISLIEITLQKMMEVRSTGIYPLRVNITFDESK